MPYNLAYKENNLSAANWCFPTSAPSTPIKPYLNKTLVVPFRT